MAMLMRLIWRLDYPLNYEFQNNLGKVRKALFETVPKYWNVLTDGAYAYSFTANYRNMEHRTAREISVELQSINGTFQWSNGTDLVRVLQTEEFRNLDRVVREISRIISLRDITRAGFRFLGLGRFKEKSGTNLEQFTKQLSNKFVTGFEKSMSGRIQDLAVTLVGKTDDSMNYRIACGPTSANDSATLFGPSAGDKEVEILKEYDFTFDIDLFEFNASFVEHNLFRWGTTKLERAVAAVAMLESIGT
jgi:hypothetical protein